MPPTTYDQWVRDGSPWRPAAVIDLFATLLRNYGFTVYTRGDESHLTADIPEDHTPFSHTPWPGAQPYPQVLALDVMPGGPIDWRLLGLQIVNDRRAEVPGTEWIKYVNWTTWNGSCWHYSWEPDLAIRSSTDTGHIHISARTDHVDDQLHGWDPVARLRAGGGVPSPPRTLTKGNDDMPSGDLPAAFGIDEKNDWLDLNSCVSVPLPEVGSNPNQWGPAWLYLSGTDRATIRFGCYPSAVWNSVDVDLTHPAGPLSLPAGTTLLLLARKRPAPVVAGVPRPGRWHVQYGRQVA